MTKPERPPWRIAVCQGGDGWHALGMHGARGADWAAAMHDGGNVAAVLVVEALVLELAEYCELAGIRVLDLSSIVRPEDEKRFPPPGAYPADDHWISCRLARALCALERRGIPIGEVEFPDRGGWGFATLQARMLEGLLADATIAIRIEGAHALCASYRAEPRTLPGLILADLERKALADCDVLRAESRAVVDSILAFHEFELSGRRGHVDEIACLPTITKQVSSRAPAVDTSIVCWIEGRSTASFSMIARALSGIVAAQAGWRGDILLLGCRMAAGAVTERLSRQMRSRVTWRNASVDSTLSELASCIWLDADPWSASSSPAQQASAAGAVCVVPNANPAYSGPAWVDGISCLRHDGSVSGMVAGLQRAFVAPLQSKVVDTPVCQSFRMSARTITQGVASHPTRITVVIPHYNLGAYLEETVESARRCTPAGTEILVVDDASDEPASRLLIDDWHRAPPPGVRVLRLPFNVGLGAARNAGVAAANGDFILPLDADDLLAPGFAARAASALQRYPEFDLVIPQAAYFVRSPDPGALPIPTGHITFVGEARESGLHANRFSTSTASSTPPPRSACRPRRRSMPTRSTSSCSARTTPQRSQPKSRKLPAYRAC